MLRDMALLHGGGQGGWIWEATIAAIRLQDGSDARHILALDIPGCGTKRGRDTAGLDHAAVIEELARDIEAAGLSDALLVGHSQAGTVLPRLSTRSARIARTAYVTCCAPEKGQTVSAMMGIGIHGADPDSVGWPLDPLTTPQRDLFRAMFCNDMTAAEADGFLATLGNDAWPAACGMAETNWSYAEARTVPALYVIALRDAILPPAWQQRFAERIGAIEIARVDTGHQPMNTHPHALAEILRSFATISA
ncbi:alpha/beta hydrolase [Sphingobium sp. Sx8-8]|uniref:alpha/beta fold hydrolase n=1 Tax=Sphingobium sp. Sx8-8 TaxID=2933617 RepID=UPI001F598EAC|nr:alpha/beta hydrolase [Sphingobium sp. Sx8-8]